MKSHATYIAIICFLLYVAGSALHQSATDRADRRRMEQNLQAAQSENQSFRALNGQQAQRLEAQQLTIAELRRTLPEAIAAIKNLQIPPRRVQTFAQATATVKEKIVMVVKDSIVRDTVRVARIDYFDRWFDIRGTITGDTARIDIESRDRLTIVNHQGQRQRRFLFFRVGPRTIETVITNENPHCKIFIEKSITVKK